MPFTVAHAAAVLPFRRMKLVWSAFIVGSMAPDFPYILGTTRHRDLGHHLPGLILFTIPAAFAALWLFHNVIKRPVVGLMPRGMQARLQPQLGEFRFGGGARFAAITLSMALGIASHIVWDSFTHSFTWAWREFYWLHHRIPVPLLGNVPGYSVAQYGSTFVGLAALAIWVGLWYRRTTPEAEAVVTAPRHSRVALAVTMFAIAAVVALLRALLRVGIPVTRGQADHFFLILSVTALALAFWQLLFYCLLVSTYQARTTH
jgi:Domain of unknown function (DUF4184)